jgi:hypothetical protein
LNCEQGQQLLSEEIEEMEVFLQDVRDDDALSEGKVSSDDRGPSSTGGTSSPGGTFWIATKQVRNLQYPARATAEEKKDDLDENIEPSRLTDKVTSTGGPARSEKQIVSFYGRDPRTAGYSFNHADLSTMSQEEFLNQVMKHQTEANKLFGGMEQTRTKGSNGYSFNHGDLSSMSQEEFLNQVIKHQTEANKLFGGHKSNKTDHQVESKGFKEYKEQENAFKTNDFAPRALSQDALLVDAMKKQRKGKFF